MKILFIYKDLLKEGGMPQEIRNLISAFDNDVHVSVLCEMLQHNFLHRKNINIAPIKNNLNRRYFRKNAFDICIFVGFSDLINIRMSRYVLKERIPYVILPLSQINSFLDFDNPFEKNALPDVRLLENKNNIRSGVNRVKNGRKDINAYFRKLKRVLFRKTLGKIFLSNAAAIGVFSDFEKNEINLLFPNNDFYYFPYFFGTDVDKNKSGKDQYPNDNKINIAMWGRVDYYYKGIDRIINALHDIKEKIEHLRISIIGPDYNNGYEKLEKARHDFGLTAFIKIIKPGEYTPGTLGLLANADISILLSRWDGFPRALRESVRLGVPIIASREAHFDMFVSKYKIGFVVDKKNDLEKILIKIDQDPKILKTLKSNAIKNEDKLSLECASSEFKKNLKKLMPCC